MDTTPILSTPIAPAAQYKEVLAGTTFHIKTVAVCDTQPIMIEGVRMALVGISELHFLGAARSLEDAWEILRYKSPAVLMLDRAFGVPGIETLLNEHRRDEGRDGGSASETEVIVWGTSITQAEACRLIQAGAKCVLNRTVGPLELVDCLRAVSIGRAWAGKGFGLPEVQPNRLTRREHQVIDLLERNCSNKDIAQEMGIGVGTVKVHMKNIFHKTGIRSRFGLALSRRRSDDRFGSLNNLR